MALKQVKLGEILKVKNCGDYVEIEIGSETQRKQTLGLSKQQVKNLVVWLNKWLSQ